MLCRQGMNWFSALLFLMTCPGIAFCQVKKVEKGLILQVDAVADTERPDADDLDDDDADEEAEVRQEITVTVKQDGQSLTVTQTVEGDFVGEITKGEETTAIQAKTMKDLKEKFPDAYAAINAKPVNPVANAGAPAAVSVQMTNNNGERKVEAKEPGRKITMRDQQGKNLEVTLEQDLERGTRKERYDAPHFDALRKTHPEIAQLVKQYRDGAIGFGGAVNLQVQAVPFRGGQIGGLPGQAAGPRKIVGEHDGQKVVIRDEGGRKIKMTVTKTVDGEEVTEEFEAETIAELKKSHPEIAKIYEKLAGKGQPQPQNQFGGIVIGNGVPIQVQVQAQAIPVPALPDAPAAAVPGQDLQIVKRLLQQSQARLNRLAADPKFADAEAVKKIAEELAATAKKLEELEAKPKR